MSSSALIQALAGLWFLLAAPLQAAQPIIVSYIEKPPYYYTEAGAPRGFLLERARQILVAAGLEPRLESRPARRILADLEANRAVECSIGWFRTAQREAFARYSLPIYRDDPLVVAVRADRLENLSRHATLAALLADPALHPSVIDGYSYGVVIDALLAERSVERGAASAAQNLRKIAEGRADYTFIDARELSPQLREAGLDARQIALRRLADIPAGNTRHLMCSKQVSEATMARIDKAIKRIPSP